MTSTTSRLFRRATIAAAIFGALGWAAAAAQFGPPSTVWGSVTDEAGPVEAGLPVEAYVGDKLCGKGLTEFTGDGPARVTVYYADVVSREQTPGCGFDGAVVRLKIGPRDATQTAEWHAGPVHVDVTFGNVTPAPIPTFTPAPRTSTPLPGAQAPGVSGQAVGSETPSQAGAAGALSPAALTATATLSGGVISSTTNPGGGGDSDGDGDGGFPIWGVVVVILGAVGVIGGGAGIAMARANSASRDRGDYPPS